MSRGYSADERRAIANGEFFTAAELAASPYKRGLAARFSAGPGRTDPNTRPLSAKQRAVIEAMVPVCGHCAEPGDDRSALGDDGMHPECAEVWEADVAARKARRRGEHFHAVSDPRDWSCERAEPYATEAEAAEYAAALNANAGLTVTVVPCSASGR